MYLYLEAVKIDEDYITILPWLDTGGSAQESCMSDDMHSAYSKKV